MKRKAIVFLSACLLLCGAVFFFRYQLLIVGAKTVLGRALPKDYAYDEISVHEETIVIQGLRFTKDPMQVTFDQVEFGLDFKEVFSHPSRMIALCRGKFAHWSELLIPIKKYGLNLTIQKGVLTLDKQRYYFQFQHGEKKHEVGTVSVSHDPGLIDHPFLVHY